jgi:hypothetical protein
LPVDRPAGERVVLPHHRVGACGGVGDPDLGGFVERLPDLRLQRGEGRGDRRGALAEVSSIDLAGACHDFCVSQR